MKIAKLFYVPSIIGLLIAPNLFAAPSKAATAFPGENGKIAFSKTNSDLTNIWTMGPNGNNKKALTKNGASKPVWSPNGRKIIFVSNNQLQIMKSDGSARRNLTVGNYGVESTPVWSADGTRIAFAREETGITGNTRSAIFSIKPNGTEEVNISGWANNKGYRAPSWAPDGNRLVYEHYGETQSKLVVKNIQINHQRTLATLSDITDSAAPAWSPNGKKILFKDSSNEIYTIWPDSSHRAVISDGDSYAASWSPDGERIAFLEDFDGGDVSISEENGDVTIVPINNETYQEISEPSWSPDGTKLVFQMAYSNQDQHISDIFSVDLSDENFTLKKLTSGKGSEFNWQAR